LRMIEILERVGQPYALDYILGLPRLPRSLADGSTVPLSEEETIASIKKELMEAAELFAGLRHCYRIAPFMIQYMPGTSLIMHGINAGELDGIEVDRLEKGLHDNYMAMGSFVNKPERLRLLQGYRVMLRLMCFLSPSAKKALLRLKAYKLFWMAPFRFFITFMDIGIALRDLDARTYVRNYLWWFMKRFDRNYHLYMFKKRTRFQDLPDGPFQLPKDGVLLKKGDLGWETAP